MNIIDLLCEKKWLVKDAPDKVLHKTFPASHAPNCTWELFCNGNKEARKVQADQWGEIEVPPFSFAVFWNGWLAGVFGVMGDGQMAANAEGANMETLLESIKAAQ